MRKILGWTSGIRYQCEQMITVNSRVHYRALVDNATWKFLVTWFELLVHAIIYEIRKICSKM